MFTDIGTIQSISEIQVPETYLLSSLAPGRWNNVYSTSTFMYVSQMASSAERPLPDSGIVNLRDDKAEPINEGSLRSM